MTSPAPTRQTLRYLRRVCNSIEQSSTAARNVSTTRSSLRATGSAKRAGVPTIQTPTHQHAFSTSARSFQEPNSSTDTNTRNDPTPAPPIPDISNFYTLFPSTFPDGPPPSGRFDIPLPALKREFLQLQSQHHPDKYTSAPSRHSKSLALSALLNNAYKTLSDPLLRARYLLAHTYAIDITSEDNSTHRGVTDHATLMEVMEAQEAIEEAHAQDQIDALKVENRARIQEAEQKLAAAFEGEDVDTAKKETVRLNYWRSLQQGLDDWEPGKDVRLIH